MPGGNDASPFSQPVQTNGMNGIHVELMVVNAGGAIAPTDVGAITQVSNDLRNWTTLTAPTPIVATCPGRTVDTR